MKRIIVFVLLSLSLSLSSCVQHMEEGLSTQIAGIWAFVDEQDMASRFFVFDKGNIYDYRASRPYYVGDNTFWGFGGVVSPSYRKYKYSVVDGVLYYNDNFKDVQHEVVREGKEMMLGSQRCVLVEKINEGYFSEIVLSETNNTRFPGSEECSVEWEYHIENPIYDYEMELKEVPEWCTDVTVGDGVISFKVQPGVETRVGNFILSYPTAELAVVEMTRGLVELFVDDQKLCFRKNGGTAIVNFTIQNARAGVSPKVTGGGWVRATVSSSTVLLEVDENKTFEARSCTVVLSYDELSVPLYITQAAEGTWSKGFWVGDWRLRGANGAEMKFTLSDTNAETCLHMTGYAGLAEEYVITVHRKEGQWAISNQIIGKVDLGNGKVGNLWVYGGTSKGFSVPKEGVDICFWEVENNRFYMYKGSSGVEFIALAIECDGEWQCKDDVIYPDFPASLFWDGD